MTSQLLYSVTATVLAVAGLACGPLIARLAARRTLAQPLLTPTAEEQTVLASVLATPALYPRVAALTGKDFSRPENAALWDLIAAELGPERIPADETAMAAIIDELTTSAPDLPAALVLHIAHLDTTNQTDQATGVGATQLMVRLSELTGPAAGALTDPDAVLAAGGVVLAAGEDRTALAGSGPVAATGDPDVPLARQYRSPSTARSVGTALAVAVTFALAAVLNPYHGLPAVLAAAAVLALAATSALIALVDLDTFYLDQPVLLAGGGTAWALAVAADTAAGHPGRLLAGAGLAAGIGITFEVANRAYKAVRGRHGMGMGDTLIVLATGGIPVALTGNIQVGLDGLIAGLLAGIGVWAVGALRGRVSSTTAFAFGPYLAVGWVLGWAGAALIGQV